MSLEERFARDVCGFFPLVCYDGWFVDPWNVEKGVPGDPSGCSAGEEKAGLGYSVCE